MTSLQGCMNPPPGDEPPSNDPPPPDGSNSDGTAFIEVRDGVKDVLDGDVLYINGTPRMPEIVSSLVGGDSTSSRWTFNSSYERRTPKDDQILYKELTGTEIWKTYLDYSGKFFGGDIKVTSSQSSDVRTFKILGNNPEDSIAETYFRANQGWFWFAYKIGRHETRTGSAVYNQFHPSGTRINEPYKGLAVSNNGWGIMQIDPASGMAAITQEAWNWQENVQRGLVLLNSAKGIAATFFASLRRYYANDSRWEEPPAQFVVPGTSTDLCK